MSEPLAEDIAVSHEITGRRNYQACLECKKHKVKCRLGDPEHPKPPCVRCRRARLPCVFGPARKLRSRTSRRANPAASPVSGAEEHPTEPLSTTNPDGQYELPQPAMTSATEDMRSIEPSYGPAIWTKSALCRDGHLTPLEAEHLVDHFFRWMHPLYPLVDHKYSQCSNKSELVTQDPLLFATILAVTSRYTWYQASAFSARAVEVHGFLYRWVQSAIQSCIWISTPRGCDETTTLGLIESIMLIVEWHPRSLDATMPVKDIRGNYALETFGYSPTPDASDKALESEVRRAWDTFKPVNTTSWRLLCIAINIADEIGLQQVITTAHCNRSGTESPRRAHVRHFLVSLVWERSFRLGRTCLLSHPPGDSGLMLGPSSDHPLKDMLHCRIELYRLARLIESTLYPTVRRTHDIIVEGNYMAMINDFSALLATWKTHFEGVKASSPPLAKHLEIMWHTIRSFLHSVSLLAYTRKAGATASGPVSKCNATTWVTMSSNAAQAEQSQEDREGIRQMFQEAQQTVELALELHRDGLFRSVPLNILYHTISASLILLRIQQLSSRAFGNPMDLLLRLLHALEEASIDDACAASRYACCFRKMLEKVEEDRRRKNTRANHGEHQNMPDYSTENIPLADGDGNWSDVGMGMFDTGESSLQEQLMFLECGDDWTRWLTF